VSSGDCVLDVGANIGWYTARLSQLVGANGRVFAFEPMPETFHLLAFNARLFPFPNVTLLNVAASDSFGMAGMEVPLSGAGTPDLYQARLASTSADTTVYRLPLDALSIPGRVSFVKVDVEGHEINVLRGMERTLRENRPRVVVEGRGLEVKRFMHSLGYAETTLVGSPNSLFSPP
jgi:FkbM family methyltransferase